MPELVNHRWKVADQDFAARFTIPDIKGFFDKIPLISGLPSARSLVIEPGTRSAIIENGVLLGELYAGQYTLENFIDRFKFWENRQATVYLTRSEDVAIDLDVTGLPTVEGVCVNVTCTWAVQMQQVVLFVENLLGPRETFSLSQLKEVLVPLLQQAIRETVGHASYDSLTTGLPADLLQDGVIGRLKIKLSRLGLAISALQTLEITPLDGGLKARQGELWLTQRENQLRQAASAIENAQVQNNADDIRKKIDLRVGLRAMVTEDRLNKIKNREDFEQGVLEIDKDRLLRQEERETLVAAYEERKADHQSLREHFLRLLDLQREQEIEALRLSIDHAAKMKSLEHEIQQARLVRSADGEQWQAELQKERDALAHSNEQRLKDHQAKWARLKEARQHRRDDEWEALLHEQRAEEVKADLARSRMERQRQAAILQAELENRLAHEKLEIQKRQETWEREAKNQRSTSQLDRLQRVQEMNAQFAEREQRLKLEMETLRADQSAKHELERLQTMSTMGTDVLIATAGAANAQLLADLKKHEASQEAIKIQATSNPDAELNAERLRLYEQMNATERAKSEAVADAYKMAMQAQHQSVNQMIGGLTQAATPTVYGLQSHIPQQPPMAAAPPHPTATPPAWYFESQGQSSGPHSWGEIEQAVRAGRITASTQVWTTGFSSWLPAHQVREIAAMIAAPSMTPPPLPSGPPPLSGS